MGKAALGGAVEDEDDAAAQGREVDDSGLRVGLGGREEGVDWREVEEGRDVGERRRWRWRWWRRRRWRRWGKKSGFRF